MSCKPQTTEDLKRILKEDPPADLAQIDVSQITSLHALFRGSERRSFSGIGKWDVSGVTDFSACFSGCETFDEDLGAWNVSNGTNFSEMFAGCVNFRGRGLEKWDTANALDFSAAFCGCESLCADLQGWNTSSANRMDRMFDGCSAFDCDLSSWDARRTLSRAVSAVSALPPEERARFFGIPLADAIFFAPCLPLGKTPLMLTARLLTNDQAQRIRSGKAPGALLPQDALIQ
ncbi:MAG: BspA family leucine-rich repeat surface protein [Succinivibrio sp.]|jgi:hypothetical protein|nr:BspA family leucine-rich repeat surface protein [Succinivibrio sp.]